MKIKYYNPDDQISDWVKKYFILDHNDIYDRKDINSSVSPLTGNCWFFIVTDYSENHFSASNCHYFEIDNFSKKIAKCDFKYNNKFRLLCVQFKLGIPIKKILSCSYNSILENIRMNLKFEVSENEIVNQLDGLFLNFKIEANYNQKLTLQIIHHLKENPALKISDLSSKFYLCPRQIHRIFQEYTGHSLKSCQKYLRINESLYLMLHSNGANLRNVIYDMGYYDHNHFLKDFKLFYGATPTHLIKRNAFCFNELFFNTSMQMENSIN